LTGIGEHFSGRFVNKDRKECCRAEGKKENWNPEDRLGKLCQREGLPEELKQKITRMHVSENVPAEVTD
jgi:hypothetical protein